MARRRSSSPPMNAIERRAVISLAGIFALRMFGLFLILPVFTIYAISLEHTTPFLIGLTLGAYGLTQAALQIPFGILSDRWHRKKAIVLGLLIFALGSLIAGLADSIYGVLIGRLIQGAGAVSAAVTALLADLTREEQRTKAMAVIGISIGAVFMASMIIGPLLKQWVGVNGIFLLTAVAAVLAIVVLLLFTPEPKRIHRMQDDDTLKNQFYDVIRNPALLQLDFAIFTLHAVLTAIFVAIPFALIDLGGIEDREWRVYIPVMLLGVIGMLPFMAVSHQREKIPGMMRIAVLVLCLAGVMLALSVETSWWGLLAGLVIFFIGFNALEATLPSLITRIAPIANKGMATGVYNSAQFFGIFAGGAISGWLSGAFGLPAVLWFSFALLMVWFLLLWFAPPLSLHESKLIPFDKTNPEASALVKQLKAVPGVVEISLIADEALAYLKIDPETIDALQIKALTGHSIS